MEFQHLGADVDVLLALADVSALTVFLHNNYQTVLKLVEVWKLQAEEEHVIFWGRFGYFHGPLWSSALLDYSFQEL